MQIEEIQDDIKVIEAKMSMYRQQKQAEKLKAITDRLTANAAARAHDQKTAAYLSWYESKTYIDSLKADIEATGTPATQPETGLSHRLAVNPACDNDGTKTAKTFGHFKAGTVWEIHGTPHLVTDFQPSPAGSTAKLLPLTAKYQAASRPVTPYSAVPCRWEPATKTLTVPPADRLSPGSQIVIDGKTWQPSAQIGVDSGKIRYELQEAA